RDFHVTGVQTCALPIYNTMRRIPLVGSVYALAERFQLINDSLGHALGDELLVAQARRLEAVAGPGGLVARLGGDEFGVLLRDGEIGRASCRERVESARV